MQHSRRMVIGAAAVGATGIITGAASPAIPPAGGQARVLQIVSLADVEAEARAVLPEGAWAYVAGGEGDQWTLFENRRAFNDYPIATHRLRGVDGKSIDLGVRLLGHDLPYPILVAPSGAHLFVHPGAEAVTAGGAGRAGALYTASGASNLPLEAIAQATSGPKWFQVYLNADDGITRDILLRAKAAGYSAIVLTADAIGPGMSDAFRRLGMPFPPDMTFGNNDPRYGGSGNFLDQKTAMTLDDIGTIRSVTGLPVIVKGIMRGNDARDAIGAGAAAIQVSNHGGRQIDGVPASISVLAEVVDAVGGAVPVIFDSGIRRGIDVYRALGSARRRWRSPAPCFMAPLSVVRPGSQACSNICGTNSGARCCLRARSPSAKSTAVASACGPAERDQRRRAAPLARDRPGARQLVHSERGNALSIMGAVAGTGRPVRRAHGARAGHPDLALTALTELRAYRLAKDGIAAATEACPAVAVALEALARRGQDALRANAATGQAEDVHPEMSPSRLRSLLRVLAK